MSGPVPARDGGRVARSQGVAVVGVVLAGLAVWALDDVLLRPQPGALPLDFRGLLVAVYAVWALAFLVASTWWVWRGASTARAWGVGAGIAVAAVVAVGVAGWGVGAARDALEQTRIETRARALAAPVTVEALVIGVDTITVTLGSSEPVWVASVRVDLPDDRGGEASADQTVDGTLTLRFARTGGASASPTVVARLGEDAAVHATWAVDGPELVSWNEVWRALPADRVHVVTVPGPPP